MMTDLEIQELEDNLKSKFNEIWRCADSYKWDILKKHDLLAFDWMNVNVDYSTIDFNTLTRGKKAIYPWVEKLKKGDLIFVMGKNSFHGIAIAKSSYSFIGPQIDLGSNGIKPAINVEYLVKLDHPINHGIKTHNNPTTFAKIDQYNFGLNNVLNFLNEDFPKAINSLKERLFKMDISESISPYKKLLLYKKQIILQGPPGTGKTKLAKEIASELIGLKAIQPRSLQTNISINDIKRFITPGLRIKSAADYTEYTIQELGEYNVTVKLKNLETTYKPSYKEIISAYEIKMWEGKQVKGNDPYAAAIAKYIFSQNESEEKKIKDSEQFKIIQFHPSYTYEDFVRGIVAESKGDKIEYKNVNKMLGQFAKDAYNNLELSKADNSDIQKSRWVDLNFKDFTEHIRAEVEVKPINLSGNVTLFDVESDCFRYGKDWCLPSRINFKDFKILISAVLNGGLNTTDTKISKELSIHAHYRFTYYLSLLRQFFERYKYAPIPNTQVKNYVLIIDEINRANLSSVLGELIYALEYRGEKVDSMYEVDGENDLILPLNLYIIGTMNTADRSVGHIDYAIRRRFAFVDILPEKLEDSKDLVFNSDLFKEVAKLFISNYNEYLLDKSIPLKRADYLSAEFEAKDVWLGHSYFIQKRAKGTGELEPHDFNIRVKFEIVPILREYVKDGVLNDNAAQIINQIEKAHSA